MFSVDRKVFSVDRKVFPLTRKYFPLTGKCFPLTNFSNGKQTQESLESCFPENEFRETNMAQSFKRHHLALTKFKLVLDCQRFFIFNLPDLKF
jgi:hypothetical protein